MAVKQLNIILNAQVDKFKQGIENASKSLNKLEKDFRSFERLGKSLTVGVTVPVVAMAYKSVEAFQEEEMALNKLSTAISQNGKNITSVLPQYEAFAKKIQNTTTVADDQVYAMLQMAESMQLANPQQAVEGAIGLSKAFGIDLDTALKATAKGLSGQWGALQRLIPSIKLAGSDSKKMAMFQKMMADSMAIATGEVNTSSGAWQQAKNKMGDAMETMGANLAPIIVKVSNFISMLAEKISNMSEGTKKFIVTFSLLIATIGPGLVVFSKMIGVTKQFFVALKVGGNSLNRALGWVGLLITVATLIISYWEPIAAFFQKLWLKIEIIFLRGVNSVLKAIGKITKIIGIDFDGAIERNEARIKKHEAKLSELDKTAKKTKNIFNENTLALKNFGEETEKASESMEDLLTPLQKAEAEYEKWQKEQEKFIKKILPENNLQKNITKAPTLQIPVSVPDVLSRPTLFEQLSLWAENVGNSFKNMGRQIKLAGISIIEILTQMKDTAISAATDGFLMLGEAIGRSLAGDTQAFKSMGDRLLSILYDFLGEYGKAIALKGVADIVSGINAVQGALEIAAGMALMALSGAGQAGIEKRAQANQMADEMNSANGFRVNQFGLSTENINVNGIISGRDIILSSKRTDKRRQRI